MTNDFLSRAKAEAQDLRIIAAELGGVDFPYAPSLLSAAQTIDIFISAGKESEAELERLRAIGIHVRIAEGEKE